MQISNKRRYGKYVSDTLSALEEMHDSFRQQIDFCFRTMFEEFEIEVGDKYIFNNPFKVKIEDNKEYTILSVEVGNYEYAYINCIDEYGHDIIFEPYYLDVYEDFETMFSEVYDHLRSEVNGNIPTDEFALSTFKYLEQECKWANENKMSLEEFGKRMGAHNIDISNRLFDLKIGAFIFTISICVGKFVVNNSYEIYNGDGLYFRNDTIIGLKARKK